MFQVSLVSLKDRLTCLISPQNPVSCHGMLLESLEVLPSHIISSRSATRLMVFGLLSLSSVGEPHILLPTSSMVRITSQYKKIKNIKKSQKTQSVKRSCVMSWC